MLLHDRSRSQDRHVGLAPISVVALAGLGLAFVLTGALLATRSGAFVSFGETVRSAILWCF